MTTQQIIDVGPLPNDGQGDPLRTAFQITNDNFSNIWAAGPVGSQVVIANNVISTSETNLDLILQGNGIGTVTLDSTTVPGIDAVYDLGSLTQRFNSIYGQYFYGNGAYLTGITGLGATVTFNNVPPVSANIGDIWIQSNTAIQYLYFNDGSSNQWAEMEAYQTFSSLGNANGNVDLTYVQSDIIPSATNSYSLGNSARQWQDLWVSNGTIYMNGVAITSDGANLKYNGNIVLTTNSTPSYASLTVTGNVVAGNTRTGAVYTDNYYYANGAPFPQGSNSLPGTTIQLKDNAISTTVVNQNLVLKANGIGVLQTDTSIVPGIDDAYDLGSSAKNFDTVYTSYVVGNGATFTSNVTAQGNVSGTYILGNGYFLTGVGNASGNADLTNVQSNIVPAANVYSIGSTGNQWQNLWVKDTINLNSVPLTMVGTTLRVNGTNVLTTGGSPTFAAVSVTGNTVANAVYTDNYFYANGAPFPQGSNSVPGTTISLKDNVISTTVTNQNLILKGNGIGNVQANSSIMPSVDEAYDIGSPTYRFDTVYAGYFVGNGAGLTGIPGGNADTGNVTFNDINIIGTGNLHLQPDPNNAGAFLDVYLTVGPDIHIAGNGENVIVGRDDNSNIMINANGAVAIQSYNFGNTQNYIWNFGVDGKLTLSDGTSFVPFSPGSSEWTAGANGYVSLASNNGNTYAWVDNLGAYIATNWNSGAKQWTFDAVGNLIVPGNMVINGNINVFGSDTALIQPANDIPLALISSGANAGTTTFWVENISDPANSAIAGMYAPLAGTANVRIVTGNNATTVNFWEFDSTGNLTAPGNVVANTFVSNAFNVVTAGNLSITSQYGLGFTGTILEDNGSLELLANGSGCVVVGWNSTYGNGLGPVAQMYFNPPGNSGNAVLTTGNIADTSYDWIFGADGNLTLPTNTANINYSNGVSILNGIGGSYGNANVASFLADFGSNAISTSGNITASYFAAVNSANVLSLTTRNGDANPNYTRAQLTMGYLGTTDYPQFIHTIHNAGSTAYNTIEFWTSDGTQTGTFPANAVLGGSITQGAMQLAVYANTAQRDSVIVSPQPGMMIYVTGTGMQVRGATSWNTIAGSGT